MSATTSSSAAEHVISNDGLTLAQNVSEAIQFVLGTPSHVQVPQYTTHVHICTHSCDCFTKMLILKLTQNIFVGT